MCSQHQLPPTSFSVFSHVFFCMQLVRLHDALTLIMFLLSCLFGFLAHNYFVNVRRRTQGNQKCSWEDALWQGLLFHMWLVSFCNHSLPLAPYGIRISECHAECHLTLHTFHFHQWNMKYEISLIRLTLRYLLLNALQNLPLLYLLFYFPWFKSPAISCSSVNIYWEILEIKSFISFELPTVPCKSWAILLYPNQKMNYPSVQCVHSAYAVPSAESHSNWVPRYSVAVLEYSYPGNIYIT